MSLTWRNLALDFGTIKCGKIIRSYMLSFFKIIGSVLRNGYPGSKIPLNLQDLRRILTRTSCKSLQETYKIVSKTVHKISAKTDVLPRFLPRFFQGLTRTYKINKLLSPG